MTDNRPVGIGHNAGPAFDPDLYEGLEGRVSEFNDAAGEYLQLGELENADQAAKVNDFLTGARKLAQDIDTLRKREKEPWAARVKEVDSSFKRLTDRLKVIADRVQAMQNGWLRKEQERLDERRRQERERIEAERRRIADEAAKAQARFDSAAQADVESKLKELEREEKRISKPAKAVVESATGAGKRASLRMRKVGRIVSYAKVLTYYREDEVVREAVQKCVDRDVRARGVDDTKIPGIEIVEEEA